jgi:Fe-S-cluster containining protein
MIEGKCNQCGKCCRTLVIKIEKPTEEMRKIMEWRGVNVIDIDDTTSAIISDSYKCKFLSRSNTCLIYNDRPETCKKYPDIPNTVILPNCGFKEVKE